MSGLALDREAAVAVVNRSEDRIGGCAADDGDDLAAGRSLRHVDAFRIRDVEQLAFRQHGQIYDVAALDLVPVLDECLLTHRVQVGDLGGTVDELDTECALTASLWVRVSDTDHQSSNGLDKLSPMSEQSEDMVYLTVGPEYDDGELIPRAQMPNDAFPAAGTVKGDDVEGVAGKTYEVWAVER